MHSVRLIVNQAGIERDVRGVGGESARRAARPDDFQGIKLRQDDSGAKADKNRSYPLAAASSPLCSATSHFVGTVPSLHCFQSSIKRLAPCIRQRQAAVGICKQRRSRRSHLTPRPRNVVSHYAPLQWPIAIPVQLPLNAQCNACSIAPRTIPGTERTLPICTPCSPPPRSPQRPNVGRVTEEFGCCTARANDDNSTFLNGRRAGGVRF